MRVGETRIKAKQSMANVRACEWVKEKVVSWHPNCRVVARTLWCLARFAWNQRQSGDRWTTGESRGQDDGWACGHVECLMSGLREVFGWKRKVVVKTRTNESTPVLE